jgi:putative ABC transport system permease protein
MFDLEKEIRKWRRGLQKNASLRDGDIAELESHLREEMARQTASGADDETAFRAALARSASSDALGAEFKKSLPRRGGSPASRGHRNFLAGLFPGYLRLALRRMVKHKGYSLINVLALTVGIAASGFALLYVLFETSIDTYHKDVDRLYRVGLYRKTAQGEDVVAGNYTPLAPALKEQYPQVEFAAQLLSLGFEPQPVVYRDKAFKEANICAASPDLIRILDIPLLRGDPGDALERKNTVLLSERMARKYFGVEDPLGKIVRINDKDCEVTGVVGNPPANTQVQHDILMSVRSELEIEEHFQGWKPGIAGVVTLIKLKPGVDAAEFERLIRDLPAKYAGEVLKKMGAVNLMVLQPLKKLYLYESTIENLRPSQKLVYLYIFSAIAVLILVLACMNFVNLATARSAGRAGEVGVRKAAGAERRQLIVQFLGESLFVAFASLALAVVVILLFLPAFKGLTGIALDGTALLEPVVAASLIGLTVLIGLASGIYPALFLSSFQPVVVLKGRLRTGLKGVRLRRALVVAQFAISIFLIIGTLIIAGQVGYMRGQPLGFAKEQRLVINFRTWGMMENNYDTVKSELLRHPDILAATACSGVPGKGINRTYYYPTGLQAEKGLALRSLRADHDFFRVFDIPVVAGRPFQKDIRTDTYGALVLNEQGARAFGWATADEAVGKTMSDEPIPVVGIVKDFHWWGLQRPIEPMVVRVSPDLFRYIAMKVDTKDLPGTIAHVKAVYDRLFPGEIFEYFFVDEAFDRQYATEVRMGLLFRVFTGVALFIACLGLLGLTSFIAEQRAKEIGIRKVLGASVPGLISLMSLEFTRWVLLANLIAWPAAYFVGRKWLENFATRMPMPWGLFLLGAGLALAIAHLTVSYQSVRAATANPVESLRYE